MSRFFFFGLFALLSSSFREHFSKRMWAEVLKRLRADSGTFDKICQNRRLKQKGNGYRVERLFRRLVELLGDPAAEPTPNALEELRSQVRKGSFGQRKLLTPLLAMFSAAVVHRLVREVFLYAPKLTKEEKEMLGRVRERANGTVREQAFLLMWETWNAPGQLHDVRSAARFCMTKRATGGLRRIMLLTLCGFSAPELDGQIAWYKGAEASFKELKKSCKGDHNWHSTDFFNAAELIGTPTEAASRHTAEEILQALTSLKKGKHHVFLMYTFALRSLGQHDKARVLEEHRDARMTQRSNREVLEALSPWHKQLVTDMEEEEKCGSHRSAFAGQRMARLRKSFSRFVLLLDKFAQPKPLEEFLRASDAKQVLEAVRHTLRCVRPDNSRVRSKVITHPAKAYATLAIRFLRGSLSRHVGCFAQLDPQLRVPVLLKGVANGRVTPDASVRRTFSREETQGMIEAARDPAEAVVLTILQEVALRACAIAHIQYETLVDEKDQPRKLCSVREKNNAVRSFMTSRVLRDRIRTLVDFLRSSGKEDLRGLYILNLANLRQPLHQDRIGEIVRARAADVGITDFRAHGHAFRHTLVQLLLEAGNSLETVSKFIDHSDPRVTHQFYFVPTPAQLDAQMVNPFSDAGAAKKAEEEEKKLQLEVAETKVRACRAMLDTLLADCDNDTRSKILSKMPNFDQILQCM
jgi:integrase